ncbi:MAG: DUF2384 domain-containing protein [Burkholderiaceae bacterium]|nr:DUF2384 domain-containing protein [Burkholderiaceae bacterium]
MTTIRLSSKTPPKKPFKGGESVDRISADIPSPLAVLRQHRVPPIGSGKKSRGSIEKRYRPQALYSGVSLFNEQVETERRGVPAQAFAGNIEKLKIPSSRAFQIFNIPKSTAAHKLKIGARFEGTDALASIRLEKLLSIAESIVANSLHPDAKNFDSGKWLGEWIERPQPALGGLKPADLLDTEAGGMRVQQVLASIESGTYQ